MELDKIISILIKNSSITSYELTKIGYIEEDITELINEGYIKRRERGVYGVGNLDTLISYAKEIENRNSELSNEIIDYCNLCKGTDIRPYFKHFDKAIQEKKYSDIVPCYRNIDKVLSKDEKGIKNSNLYLLLLSYLYDMPEEYKDRLENMDLEEILLSGEDEKTKLENKLRKDLYFKSFYEARVSFKKRVSMESEFSIEDKIEKDLISSIIEKYRNLKEEVIKLIDEDKFNRLLKVLYREDEMNFLNVKSSYLLRVVIDYLDIEKSEKAPNVRGESSNTFQAIKNKDYRKALKFMEDYKTEKNINYQDTLYLMLIKMNALIDTLEKDKVEEIKEEVKIEEVKPKIVSVSDTGDKGKSVLTKVIKVPEAKKIQKEKTDNSKEKVVVEVEKKENKIELLDKDKKRIEKQVQQVYDGKLVIILDKIDPSKYDLALEYLKTFKEITEFIVGEGNNRKVIVRSRPYIAERYNIYELVQAARSAFYQERDYKKAEELYRLLLQIGTPRDKTYGEYGLTLLKLHRRREAIPYLQVATMVSKEYGGNIDYSDLLLELDKTIPESQKKPRVRMNEDDFSEKKTFDLELDYLNDLIALVREDELDLEEAMDRLGLDENNKNIVRLIYAKDCYYIKDYKLGDIELKKVIKSKDKSNTVKKLLNEVTVNKKYYKNRYNKEENQLVLKK